MWNYVIIALVTLALTWAVKFLNWVWIEPKRMERFLRKQGLNGNSYRFLHGDTKDIAAMYEKAHSKPIGFYDDIVPRTMPFIANTLQKYGKNSFAWIGPKPRIIITDGDLMKVVLNKYRNYPKKVSNKFINLAIGGLAHHEGDEWNKSRLKLNPAFHLDILKQKIPGMQACAEDILNQWMNKMSEDGSVVVDVLHDMEDFSGSVVTRTLFSAPFNEEMKRNFQHIMDLTVMASTASKPFSIPGFWYLPTQTKKKAMRMEKELRDSFTTMINGRLSRRKMGDESGQDLLDVFLDELYHGNFTSNRIRKIIIEEAIGNCKLFYFAGYDTTSSLLTWTLVTLGIHQNWQARAREEVFQVLGNRSEITNDNLNQLKIVTMILYEVLRLYPPVMEISRVVEEDTELGEYHIPKGVLMQLPVAILHRNKEIWGDDALDFRPDRFAEGVLKAANGNAAFMPFSWGPRICLGQNFALIESKIFVAQLLRTFSIELSPTYIHAPYSAYMIQPQYGAPLLLHKLQNVQMG